jgi:hypothetical protein
MKNACRNWNDEMLSDEQILTHLEMLSGGQIKLVQNDELEFKAFERSNNQQPQNRNRNFKHRGNGGQNRFRNGGQNQNRNRNFRNNRNRPN